MGTLYYGDNLGILRRHLDDEVERPPTVAIDETFKRAPKAKGKAHEQAELL